MIGRFPTIGIPLLALVVVTIVVSHDLLMAAGPHSIEAHAAPDHEMLHDGVPNDTDDTEPDDHAAACGTFEAVRASDRHDFDGTAVLSGRPDSYLAADESEQVTTTPAEPGAPPSRIRAMLQVFLN